MSLLLLRQKWMQSAMSAMLVQAWHHPPPWPLSNLLYEKPRRRRLRGVAERLENGSLYGFGLYDSNGNRVGSLVVNEVPRALQR